MAAEINWHRYGTKLRHCHFMYGRIASDSQEIHIRLNSSRVWWIMRLTVVEINSNSVESIKGGHLEQFLQCCLFEIRVVVRQNNWLFKMQPPV